MKYFTYILERSFSPPVHLSYMQSFFHFWVYPSLVRECWLIIATHHVYQVQKWDLAQRIRYSSVEWYVRFSASPNRVIAKYVKSNFQYSTFKVRVEGDVLIKTGATSYHVPLGLPNKGHSIRVLVVWKSWDLEPLELLKCPALGWNPPIPEV